MASVVTLPGFDRILGDKPFLYLTRKDSVFIFQNLESIRILTAPSMLYDVKMASTPEEVLQGMAYADYSMYLDIMQYFQETWPEICSIDTIGYSVNGRLLLAAHLEKDIENNPLRPNFFYSSTMHGDETLGYSLMLMLINEILVNNESPEIDNLLSNVSIYINPLENPDGTYKVSDETVFGSARYNANGEDLNRNYPNPLKGDHPDFADWQAETIAMMDYLSKIRPNISANFHGGAEVVNYPWDTYVALHPDDEWLKLISSEYADTAMEVRLDYMDEFPGGITNGYDWYWAFGTRQDYVCYYLNGRELTIELFDVKTTPESLIKELWDANRNSMINLIAQSQYGLHGIVTDFLTGNAIEAKIEIPGYDDINTEVYSDSVSGFFVKYLKEGIYNIEISAAGYEPYSLTNFNIQDYTTHTVDIKLKLIEDTIPILFDRVYYGNPFGDKLYISINNPIAERISLYIYSMKGSVQYSDQFNLIEGWNEIKIVHGLHRGLYILKLEFSDGQKSYKLYRY